LHGNPFGVRRFDAAFFFSFFLRRRVSKEKKKEGGVKPSALQSWPVHAARPLPSSNQIIHLADFLCFHNIFHGEVPIMRAGGRQKISSLPKLLLTFFLTIFTISLI
jgi:hypothetical protein